MEVVIKENILFDLVWGGPEDGMIISTESGGTSNKKPKKPKKDNFIKKLIKKIFKRNKNKDLGDKLKDLENKESKVEYEDVYTHAFDRPIKNKFVGTHRQSDIKYKKMKIKKEKSDKEDEFTL